MGELQLYSMDIVGTAGSSSPPAYDYLLLAGGSDTRAYEILRKAKGSALLLKNTVLFDFEERKSDPEEKVRIAYKAYENYDCNVHSIECSIKDPSACLKSLEKNDLPLKEGQSIAVDISCFTKPYFFAILKYLKDHKHLSTITVFYTEPIAYRLSKGFYKSYHSSEGPLSIIELPGFPGLERRAAKSLLVVLVGFDGELSSYISEEVAPEKTIVVNGFPSYTPKFKDVSMINNEKILGSSGALNSVKFARANNPFETFNLLDAIQKESGNAFLNIAPLGTKPMALGACLFALMNSSTRILYPMPEKYTNVTTERCWQSWRYVIPLK